MPHLLRGGASEENDAITVAFGGLRDTGSHPTIYLMLQRSTDEDEDEAGIAGVYAEWCDQGMSCYGCISSFALYAESIRVKFTDSADLHVPEDVGRADARRLTELLVTFTLDERTFRELKEKLSFIFKGCDCYSVHNVDASTSA